MRTEQSLPNPWSIGVEFYESMVRSSQIFLTGQMGKFAYHAIAPSFRTKRETRSFENLSKGESMSIERRMTERDDYYWASLSNSWDTLQIDADRACVPGFLVLSAIPKAVNEFLGPGWIIQDMRLQFGATAYIDDVMTTNIEIWAKIAEEERLILITSVCNQDGTLIIEGTLSVKR